MHLFGHYPAHDDFYLVVCSACNQAVKPQVFQAHCGKWTPAPRRTFAAAAPATVAPLWLRDGLGSAPVCLPQPEAAGKFFLPLCLCSQGNDFRSCSPPSEMLRPVRANERKPATCLGKWDQTEAIRPTCREPPKVTKGEGQSGGLRNRTCSPTSLKEGARLSPGV